MQPSDIFFNSVGRLRSGWRFSFYFLLIFLLSIFQEQALKVANYIATTANAEWLKTPLELLFRLSLLGIAILAGWICGKLFEDLPFRALGWSPHQGFLRDLLYGCLIGAASLGVAAAIAEAGGGLRFAYAGALTAVFKTLLVSALVFLFAAAAEEALFRGYPLQTMTRAGFIWLGIFLTSVPFAALHLDNPNVVKGFTFINTALAGVWLAVAYLRTRSLWFPLGVHWAWNWTMAAVLGIPVSGITELTPNPIMHAKDFGPAWLTGGAYGLEGGAACTIALLVSIIFIWRTKLLRATPEMKELTSHEIPKRAEISYRIAE